MLIALVLYYLPLITVVPVGLLGLSKISVDGVISDILFGLSGLAAGAFAGLLGACWQGPNLDEIFGDEHSWVPFSTLGWAGGGFILFYLLSMIHLQPGTPSPIYLFVWIFVFAIVGTSQWLWLRREVQKAYLWIPITVAAWGFGLLLASLTVGLIQGASVDQVIVRNISAIFGSSADPTFLGLFYGPLYWILVGCVAGVITYWGLRFLSRSKT